MSGTALDNKKDTNGAEHDNCGRFAGNSLAAVLAKAANKDLQKAKDDVNMYVKQAVIHENIFETLPKSITVKNDTP